MSTSASTLCFFSDLECWRSLTWTRKYLFRKSNKNLAMEYWNINTPVLFILSFQEIWKLHSWFLNLLWSTPFSLFSEHRIPFHHASPISVFCISCVTLLYCNLFLPSTWTFLHGSAKPVGRFAPESLIWKNPYCDPNTTSTSGCLFIPFIAAQCNKYKKCSPLCSS